MHILTMMIYKRETVGELKNDSGRNIFWAFLICFLLITLEDSDDNHL